VNGKGRVVQGDQVPEDSRMMEKEDAEQTSEEERKNLDEEKQEWHPVTDTLRGGCSERMVFRSVAICCWVLPSMVASSPIPLTCPVILTL
jgi:hypothetical protein